MSPPPTAPAAPAAHRRARFTRPIKGFVEHPLTKLAVGLILVATGVFEAYDSLFEDIAHLRLRVHHGMLVLGFINVLASIPDLVEGLDKGIDYLEAKAEAVGLADDQPVGT